MLCYHLCFNYCSKTIHTIGSLYLFGLPLHFKLHIFCSLSLSLFLYLSLSLLNHDFPYAIQVHVPANISATVSTSTVPSIVEFGTENDVEETKQHTDSAGETIKGQTDAPIPNSLPSPALDSSQSVDADVPSLSADATLSSGGLKDANPTEDLGTVNESSNYKEFDVVKELVEGGHQYSSMEDTISLALVTDEDNEHKRALTNSADNSAPEAMTYSSSSNISNEYSESQESVQLHADFRVVVENDNLSVNEKINFEPNTAVLLPLAKRVLDHVAITLQSHPLISLVEVAGHCSDSGSTKEDDEFEQRISEERSMAVVEYLVAQGVDRSRLVAKGYGDRVPIATNKTAEGRAKNRRVEFVILARKGERVSASELSQVLAVAHSHDPSKADVAHVTDAGNGSSLSDEVSMSLEASHSSVQQTTASETSLRFITSSPSTAANPIGDHFIASTTAANGHIHDHTHNEKNASAHRQSVEELDEDANKPVQVTVGEGVIQVSHRINFEPNTAMLKAAALSILESVAHSLIAHPEVKLVEVAGHCSNFGDSKEADEFEMRMSEARAASVVAFLASNGVDGSRLVAKGYGDTLPVADNSSGEGRARNRRVEFIILERSNGLEEEMSGKS